MASRRLPLVLVHSLAGSPAQWGPQIDHFESHRTVLAVALPGHAGRPEPSSYTVETLAAHLEQRTVRLSRFVLVGHSAGAVVAVHFAARYPDRVAGLVLVDPGTDARQFPREQSEPMLEALRSDDYMSAAEGHWSQILAGAREGTRRRAMIDLRQTPRAALPEMLAALGCYDAVTPLREYAASHPVLAITTPASEGRHALWTGTDGVVVERVDGTSHWVQLDAPDVVNGMLAGFIERSERLPG